MVAPSRALARAGAACLVAAAVLAGCTSSSNSTSSVTALGRTLSIWISVPPGVSSDPAEQDVIDAERLAFTQQSREVTDFGLRLRIAQHPELSDNARAAIQDQSTVAYLGELAPGSSEQSVGITNALDILQVSATDTALELTQRTSAIATAPKRYYESTSAYGYTFARVVPSSAQEARVLVDEMEALGVKSLYIANDGSDYGKAIAQAVRSDVGSAISVTSSEAGAGAIFYGGSSATLAATFVDAAATADPSAKLFGPSALDTTRFAQALAPSVHNLYISSPGFLPSQLNAAAKTFDAAFQSAYGHAPSGEALFGFEAMSAVLHVLAQAGESANDRAVVIHDFLSIKNRSSVLGTYSIDPNGNTTLSAFVFNRLSDGSLVPFKAAPAQG